MTSGGAGETAKEPSAWTPDLILALLEERDKRYQQRWEAHQEAHAQQERTRKATADAIDLRLQGLNELRSEVILDRGLLVTREALDAKLAAFDTKINALHDQVTEWKGREKGLLMIVGGVGFISTVLAIYFAVTGS